MATDALVRAALSAASIGLLLTLLRRVGPRAGGLAAALPISSTPALFWLWREQGADYAARAALGSLWATGLASLLALAFARLALIAPPGRAAWVAWLGIGTVAALTWSWPAAVPGVAVALSGMAILAARAALPRQPVDADVPARRPDPIWTTVGMAAAMSFTVSLLARHGQPQTCGLIAAVPVVGMVAARAGWRRGGIPLMLQVLSGYVEGMLAKAVFLGTLCAACAAQAGAAAWPMALAVAAVALVVQRRLARPRRALVDPVRRQSGHA